MKFFNALSVWTQPPIGSKTARIVKTIQTGTISNNAAVDTAATATLSTAVDTTRAVVIPGGWNSSDGSASGEAHRLELTNSTTVSSYGGAGPTSPAKISFTVVEFY